MRSSSLIVLFLAFLCVMTFFTNFVAADETIQIQQNDIAELMMKKYKITVEQGDFTVFYRLSTAQTAGEGTSEDLDAKILSMNVNQKHSSLDIKLDNIGQTDIMSIRFPHELISAEGGKFTLLVNGEDTKYELSVQNDGTNLIFLIPKQTTEVDVIGTRVIPEFPSALSALILISSCVVVLQKMRKISNKKT